ncbi:MAG TPA: ATP-binding protein [Terracidiphilus sp.]
MASQSAHPDAGVAVESHAQPMRELVQEFDWSATPLGPAGEWPESLKTTVRILLTSRFPMWMAWGPKLTMLYNDAYARITLGKKHPWALGRPAPEVWSEIWQDIGPRIARVMETGEASWEETLFLILERSGYPEETYHTFSYSPLAGQDGRIQGMFCVVMEDTSRVIGERQMNSLGTLASALVDANTRDEVFAAIKRGLTDQRDMPFALTYLFDDTGAKLNLVASSGIDGGHSLATRELSTGRDDCRWPIQDLLADNRALTVENLGELFHDLPLGVWNQPPVMGRMVPITRKGQDRPAGVFIAGLNPYRQLSSSYSGFLDLVAGQISAAITNAEAYEEERTRARALAELDRAKTAFFSNVSHELRTPLTLILGPIEDAIEGRTPPGPGTLEMLHRNALRLLKMVNGLLDFVRIEAGRLRASYEPTDLSLLTAQLASAYRSAVERAGLKLIVEALPLPEPVYVDREMWEKIVLNLLSNAFKATFDGSIRVTVSAEDGFARVAINDTGTGIPEIEVPHLFERFRRVEGARRRSHEGTGIGLALVKELVEMHGGHLEVSSTVGIGSSFTVKIPFGSQHLAHGHVVTESSSSGGPPAAAAHVREALGWLPANETIEDAIAPGDTADTAPPQPGDARRDSILLVDDNADMRDYLRSLLAPRFHVLTAENGKAALDVVKRHRPSLVVSDIMMPELDGLGLLSALRSDRATSDIPVVLLSARAGEESRIEGVGAGADDYLIKPFTARELMARVDAQLKMARLRREAREQEAVLTREIQRARQFAWETLEHLPDAFCTFDRDFRISYLNPAAAQLSSTSSPVPVLGSIVWDVYPTLPGTPVEANFRRAMQNRELVEFEQYFPGPAGDFWFHFKLYPQPNDGLALYVRNTTPGRRTEQALRRSEQLAAAGRLAASIAHEINNPLEAVTNLLFLVNMDDTIHGRSKELLQVADRELQRLSHITARSLKFYRQRTAPTLTSIDELLDSVLFFHETEMNLRGIQLERRYEPAPQVLCLAGEIQQVFTNLISNALEALDDGGRMTVCVRPGIDGKDHQGVAVIVADSGNGMAKATLDQLFHPFVTTKGEDGTGLGLWVSKGILDNHHASIKVRSKRGLGTVFRIFLPLDTTIA